MHLPDPNVIHPMPGHTRCGYLKNLVSRPTIEIGDFTYYDDPEGPERFEEHCVLYHHDFIGDRLVIGRYCAIAANTRFIMNGADHDMRGFSTYPFGIFGENWREAWDPASVAAGFRGDTVVGHDVWFGMEATIMAGVRIGHGAIVAAKAVVTREVPPYAVVAGNPARIIRMRFDEATVGRLLDVAWWDWPIDKVVRNAGAISGADIERLEAAA
jgi:virginiamycin A acetyltransferase